MNSQPLLRIILIVCTLLSCVSCENGEYEYSRIRAYFIYDNSQHLDATLMTAMNAMSPGVFCRIYLSGASAIGFENNHGLKSEQVMTAIESYRSNILGIYNESGLIVGFGNMDIPAVFFAYDAQCPNCYEQSQLPRYQLSLQSNGLATCRSCRRSYDLNNGGLIAGGDGGKKLYRYRATTTGPAGMLAVNN